MSDTVDTITLFNSPKRIVRRFTNISDGSGESAVVKFDKSALTGPDGTEPSKLVVEEISWDIQGFTSIRLLWDHDTDDEILVLGPGSGYMSWVDVGGLVDPASTGGTGDILLTTVGHDSGDTYNITMVVRKKD